MGKTKQEEPTVVEKRSLFGWFPKAVSAAIEYAETIIVLLYIFNGVAAFLILFDLVQTNRFFDRIVGSLAFAFSVFALVAFINKGVKHQSNSKKGKK
jgi:hypothetical protein